MPAPCRIEIIRLFGGCAAVGCFLIGGLAQARDASPVPVKIQIEPQVVVARIAPDFIGFGYETSALAQTNYFGGDNTALIQLYRNLTTNGLIRIGGNISDHTRYVAEAPTEVRTEQETTVINRASLDRLAAFAGATGWKVMWGLNLGTGTKEEAVVEAKAVVKALGSNLQSFEIGNEVDIHGRYRWSGRSYADYYSNYLAFKAAVRDALPRAEFSGPDVAGNLNWLVSFSGSESKDLKLLTHHYYRADAKSDQSSLNQLLQPDERWVRVLTRLRQVSRDCGVPYRINEVNSFSGGGKVGVSDTFGSALWCLDYMFLLASYGCGGVNMETDINQHAWLSHYSPIVHDEQGRCHPCAEYYGMLAFSIAGKGDLVKVNLEKSDINLTAYAVEPQDHVLWVVIINKDLTNSAAAKVVLPSGFSEAAIFRLQAPSVESKDQINFGDGNFASDGTWTMGKPIGLKSVHDEAVFTMPCASAALVRLN